SEGWALKSKVSSVLMMGNPQQIREVLIKLQIPTERATEPDEQTVRKVFLHLHTTCQKGV
ncbi:hypothetical protein ACFL6U_29120, partial [Planctomycetota bacterium]